MTGWMDMSTSTYGNAGLKINGEVHVGWFSPDENICRFGRLSFYLPDSMELFDVPLSEVDGFINVLRLLQRNALDTELKIKGLDSL